MGDGIEPAGERVRKALRWMVARRKESPGTPTAGLLDEAALRFDLTPVEQEGLRLLLCPQPTPA
jgi:hypothetical protein